MPCNGKSSFFMPAHPLANKYGRVESHRLAMYEIYGEIVKQMVVHHKDGNRFNETLENLQLLTNSEHAKLHRQRGRKYSPNGIFVCPGCGMSEKYRAKGLCKRCLDRERYREKQKALGRVIKTRIIKAHRIGWIYKFEGKQNRGRPLG